MSTDDRKPEGKESFDEAVTEQLARENEGRAGEKSAGSNPEGERKDQPALQDQDEEGNPAKTDNE